MAQLARAPALQAGGRRFESVYLHQNDLGTQLFGCVFFIPHQFSLLSPTCWQVPIQVYKSKLIYKQKKDMRFSCLLFFTNSFYCWFSSTLVSVSTRFVWATDTLLLSCFMSTRTSTPQTTKTRPLNNVIIGKTK